MTIWSDGGKWEYVYNPVTHRYESTYHSGVQSDANLALGAVILFGLWLAIGAAYIFIADYTWTTVAVVAGVLVTLSLIVVGIRRTAVGFLRLIGWVILMAVMTGVESSVAMHITHNMHGALLLLVAIPVFAVWLYSTVKITRLVF